MKAAKQTDKETHTNTHTHVRTYKSIVNI